MYFEDEINDDQRHHMQRSKSYHSGLFGSGETVNPEKHLTKIVVKKTEFEQKEMDEILNKQKKQN